MPPPSDDIDGNTSVDTHPPTNDDMKAPLRAVRASNGDEDKANEKERDATEGGANDEALLIRISALEEEHADLGAAIDALEEKPAKNNLILARLKKRKLALKDKILQLKDRLTPDIIA